MSDIIHLLPDNIANQIAAGEVIQRPSSVVKELVENAIDAGATHIQVNIKDAGRTLVQVIDNGKGMSETDARMAFERHATSKISTADDLYSLHTMGFRGEALASIVSVAQVDLLTRLKNTELGTHLVFTGSKLESCEPVGCAEGSIFSVKNLFFNVPARRKFLKSNDTEFRNILTEFERVALVCPKVAMSLYHNEVQIFDLPETGIRQRIIDVYGKKLNEKLLSVNAQSSLIGISGFVGRPDMVKKRGLLQYFFVNGRYMRHPYFHKAVLQAYEQLIPAGEQPDYFIYFTLDPSSIDVNIHPTKTEIKFENEQPIWQILMSAVRESLAVSSAVPTIDFDSDSSIKIPVYNVSQKDVNSDNLQKTIPPVNSHYNPFRVDSFKSPEFDWSKLYKNFENDRSLDFENQKPDSIETETASDPQKELISKIGEASDSAMSSSFSYYQFRGSYIITSIKSGLAIIDQHRAHIRILFDRYLRFIQQRKSVSQKMLFPDIIEFNAEEATVLPLLLDDLRFMGFEIAEKEKNVYFINGVPAGLKDMDFSALLHNMIARVIELDTKVDEEVASSMALAIAKTAAIPSDKILSSEEMDNMVASLFSCSDPNLTPDGKTILSLISIDELSKRFK